MCYYSTSNSRNIAAVINVPELQLSAFWISEEIRFTEPLCLARLIVLIDVINFWLMRSV